jgi:uncharacterized protein YlbG (UPF0298 family)
MFAERSGLIIWVHDTKSARALERYGSIHYTSRKMNYVVMYVNTSKVDETIKQLENLNFVKKIEPSYRSEIKTEYNTNIPDKTQFYTF